MPWIYWMSIIKKLQRWLQLFNCGKGFYIAFWKKTTRLVEQPQFKITGTFKGFRVFRLWPHSVNNCDARAPFGPHHNNDYFLTGSPAFGRVVAPGVLKVVQACFVCDSTQKVPCCRLRHLLCAVLCDPSFSACDDAWAFPLLHLLLGRELCFAVPIKINEKQKKSEVALWAATIYQLLLCKCSRLRTAPTHCQLKKHWLVKTSLDGVFQRSDWTQPRL